MVFNSEADFEKALITLLFDKGWERNVLYYKTEEDLIRNWADILFENNRAIDRLGDYPLTDGEMQQIIEQVNRLQTPTAANAFINGKTLAIKRDNPDDKLHLGQEISLKIYDRSEIAAGQSRYQIAQQPVFKTHHPLASDRRGDFMLLINGMPVIHVELKKSGIPISHAVNQIQKYSSEGIFSHGIFSLVQIFVAMNPESMVYFANTGSDKKFNQDYLFHWADFNNEPINDWKRIADVFLSIPMAHQLIGFYTVADNRDGLLKVLRSYQYYAANAISDRVARTKWDEKDIYGGFVWHTTGSGKTMTSFKSAQLIANSHDADKVVFLMDRIELGTQTLQDFRDFADERESVQGTEDTDALVAKLKSDNPQEVLIVTSIQKMSRIELTPVNADDIAQINAKRVVIIIDEAHRSTFGDMLIKIKHTFTHAIFFGFTGTPIYEENMRRMHTTNSIFGKELHRYSISDGIRDKNVLGFDPYMVLTYRDRDLRKAVALEKAHAQTEAEAIADDKKRKVYYHYMNDVPMAGYKISIQDYCPGIEDEIPSSQYNRDEHREAVLNDIRENWITLSRAGKFHQMLATSSIPEAMKYYHLFKENFPDLKVTCLFDPTIDNTDGCDIKEEVLLEIVGDYNDRYNTHFKMSTYGTFKKDVALRLAHKRPYTNIENNPGEVVDLLIVVDQMLTGFDSKWINTLYLDKVLKYEGLVQAFSRTNRLFGPEKPFGIIRYYRYPHTMERNIEDAFRLYSGNRMFGIFVDKLEPNLLEMNRLFLEIKKLFEGAGIFNFERLPDDQAERAMFAKNFKSFNDHLEAARVQMFIWNKLEYIFKHDNGSSKVTLLLDENVYNTLVQRYKELFESTGGGGADDVPYDIDTHITEINTEAIDSEYMNSRFKKYIKAINTTDAAEALDELHKTFATLSQEDQRFAWLFLGDFQRGDVHLEEGKTLREYIAEYKQTAKKDQIHRFAQAVGLNEDKLRTLMAQTVTEANINSFGRFDDLLSTVDKHTAKAFLEKESETTIRPREVGIKIDALVRRFILEGGFEIGN